MRKRREFAFVPKFFSHSQEPDRPLRTVPVELSQPFCLVPACKVAVPDARRKTYNQLLYTTLRVKTDSLDSTT